jgi:hypothetical protein
MFAVGVELESDSNKKYVIIKRIGSGAYGTVYHVKMKSSNDEISQKKNNLQFDE